MAKIKCPNTTKPASSNGKLTPVNPSPLKQPSQQGTPKEKGKVALAGSLSWAPSRAL